MSKIFCFGDSITYGAWGIDTSGWSTKLRKYLDKKQKRDASLYYLVYNLGIVGETTQGLIKRFINETKARLETRSEQENIFIFAYGTNDCAFIRSQNKFQVPLKKFKANLDIIISQAQKLSSKIFIINISPIDEEKRALHFNQDKARVAENIFLYNQEITKLAREKKITLIDIAAVYKKNIIRNLISEDGLHPSDQGHELFFKELLKRLKPSL